MKHCFFLIISLLLLVSLSACAAVVQRPTAGENARSEVPPAVATPTPEEPAVQPEPSEEEPIEPAPAPEPCYPGKDIVTLVNSRGEETTAYKLADGRYMDRISAVYLYDGVETWIDEAGAEWNEKAGDSLRTFSRYGRSGRIRAYLGDDLYEAYCTLLDALYAGRQEITLPGCVAEEDFQKVANAVRLIFLPRDLLRDPDFLTVTPFSFDAQTGVVQIAYCWQDETLSPEDLRCTGPEEYAQLLRSFQDTVEGILADCVSDTNTPEDNARALFQWVSDTILYEINRNDTAFTAFQNHRGYCSIYAEVYQFLAEQAGVECRRVSGATSMSWGDHEWNLINLDSTWYHVDTTFQASNHYAPGYFFAMTDEVCSARGHGEASAFHITADLP